MVPVRGGEIAGVAIANVVGGVLNAPTLFEILSGLLHAAPTQVGHDADAVGLLELLA